MRGCATRPRLPSLVSWVGHDCPKKPSTPAIKSPGSRDFFDFSDFCDFFDFLQILQKIGKIGQPPKNAIFSGFRGRTPKSGKNGDFLGVQKSGFSGPWRGPSRTWPQNCEKSPPGSRPGRVGTPGPGVFMPCHPKNPAPNSSKN